MVSLIMKAIEEQYVADMLKVHVPSGGARMGVGGVRSMRDLRTGDLRCGGGSGLPELIIDKLQSLDPDGFTERRVARKARLLLGLLRDSLSGRYPYLSMVAFAELLLAMHYFIEVRDEIPDTYDLGFMDDLRRLDGYTKAHRGEVEAYLRWRRYDGRS